MWLTDTDGRAVRRRREDVKSGQFVFTHMASFEENPDHNSERSDDSTSLGNPDEATPKIVCDEMIPDQLSR